MLILDLQFFGGRGASSASASGGGGGSVFAQNVTSANNNATSNDDATADDTTQAQPMSASYDVFMMMSDDDKADYIEQAIQSGVPVFLANNDYQKFLYNSGMDIKPQVVDDSVLDSMNGTEIFRTVNFAKDKAHGYTYTADQIAAQVMKATHTRVSDTGGSYYGRGLYFADSYSASANGYGNTRGNVKLTAVMRGKLNGNARIVNINTAQSGLSREINSGSKLGRTLRKMNQKDHWSAVSTYALSKGYNVISSGDGYLNILNRNAVTMSATIKPKGSSW